MQNLDKKKSFGELLKFWRNQKRISQLDLSMELDVSSKHISFLESGKSNPSRNMVMKIFSFFKLPLRQRNYLLVSAGYSPEFSEEPFSSSKLKIVRDAFERILKKHEPYPALVIDTSYNILMKNTGYDKIIQKFAGKHVIKKFNNSIEIIFSEDGLRKYVKDFPSVAQFLLARLREEINYSQNEELIKLYNKISKGKKFENPNFFIGELNLPVITLVFEKDKKRASFFTVLSTLGTPLDVSAQELRLELLFPLDEETKKIF